VINLSHCLPAALPPTPYQASADDQAMLLPDHVYESPATAPTSARIAMVCMPDMGRRCLRERWKGTWLRVSFKACAVEKGVSLSETEAQGGRACHCAQ
jgi:hypothetical protein